MEHPFSKDLLNFNLNIEPFWGLYEFSKPYYQNAKEEDTKEKVVKELDKITNLNAVSKDAKIFAKGGTHLF